MFFRTFFFCFFLTACLPFKNFFSYNKDLDKEDGFKNLETYERLFIRQRDLLKKKELAYKIALIAHIKIKDSDKALYYYNYIVHKSQNKKEIQEVQEKIASLYFYQKMDYKKAIYEYEKLLHLEKRAFYFLNLARSYFYVNDFQQASLEVKKILKLPLKKDEAFEAFFLRANILFAKKDVRESIEEYENLLKKYPERSKKSGVHLQLSLAYERLLQYSKAIRVLKAFRGNMSAKDIDERVKRLEKRNKMMPKAF